jgi:hypothetical protein
MFAWYVAVQPLTSKHVSKSATLMGRTHISLEGLFNGKADLTASTL